MKNKTKILSKKTVPAPRQMTASPLLLALLLIAITGLLAYANTFSVPFVFDDRTSIVDNKVIHDVERFISGLGYSYNPRRFIGYLTFGLNYHIGGLDVFGYHLVNLAIHISNAFLVYALAGLALKTAGMGDAGPVQTEKQEPRMVRNPESRVPSPEHLIPLFAALLFVAHPVQTQAVTYIVQRLASLATFFYLGAVVCYAKGRLEVGEGQWAKVDGYTQQSVFPFGLRPSPFTWYVFAVLSGLLAMHTKEIAFTLPVAIILFEFCFFGFSLKKLLILMAPLALGAVVATIGIVGSGKPLGELLSDVTEMSRETTIISRADYLITQFAVISTYLRLLVLPVNQNLDYDYSVYHSLFNLRPLLGLLLICVFLGIAVWAWRKTLIGKKEVVSGESSCSRFTNHYSLVAFGILWFFLTLSVESSIIPIKDVIFEHRLYLPSVGVFMVAAALALAVTRWFSPRLAFCSLAALIITFAFTTHMRNRTWYDAITLWSDTAHKSPGKYRPNYNLGRFLVAEGRVDEGIAALLKALMAQPGQPDAINNLAVAYGMKGELDTAISFLNNALRLVPEDPDVHYNLAHAYELKGMQVEAQKHLDISQRLRAR